MLAVRSRSVNPSRQLQPLQTRDSNSASFDGQEMLASGRVASPVARRSPLSAGSMESLREIGSCHSIDTDRGPRHHCMEITIEKLIYGGEGLAHHDGSTVFVPFVLPAERVAAAPVEQKKKFIRARVERVARAFARPRAPRDARISASAAAAITSTFPTNRSSSTKPKSCARRSGASGASNGPARSPRTPRLPGAIAIARNGKSARCGEDGAARHGRSDIFARTRRRSAPSKIARFFRRCC